MTHLPLVFLLSSCSVGTLAEPGVAPYAERLSLLPPGGRGIIRLEGEGGQAGRFTSYDCAPGRSYEGAETVLSLGLGSHARLRAAIQAEDGAETVLLLAKPSQLEEGPQARCLAASDQGTLLHEIEPGDYLLVADSSSSGSGPLQLAWEWTPQGGSTVHRSELDDGVLFERHLRHEPDALPWSITVLRIAPRAVPRLHPHRHDGCEAVPKVGSTLGALAGFNAAFFSKTCEPLCLLVSGGVSLATTRMGKGPQRALGWDDQGTVDWAWVDELRAWEGAVNAIAGYPSLVSEGAARVEPSDSSSFQTSRHPRTALGTTADGSVLLVAVDGRTVSSAGMTVTELAALMVELGAVDAINLDGGGSTTAWVSGAWLDGVVSLPSDNLRADHRGARAVSDGLYLMPARD